MQDTELYQRLLGLKAPWQVARVELAEKERRVHVWAEHEQGQVWPCPECGSKVSTYDHTDERVWRHLDSCEFTTYLHARLPRVNCTQHGVKQVKAPWADPGARFTYAFEAKVITVLLEADVSGTTRITGSSWDQVWGIEENAVARGKAAKRTYVSQRIGIDEKAIAKGQTYLTLVCDLDRKTVEFVGKDRKEATLDQYFQGLSEEQRQGIKAAALDMWDPYIYSVKKNLPDGEQKIVFDRYHIMRQFGLAITKVRYAEHLVLKRDGDERLKGTRFLWLYAEENLPTRDRERFRALKGANLKTARAWALKETFREFWSYKTAGWARRFWQRWHSWAVRSRLEPMVRVATMIKTHLPNLLTYFKNRITTALCEGFNSKIETIKKMACGFRNWEHFKTAIYFHCGGLKLYPATHTIP